MKPEYRIEEGDIVNVEFNGAQITLCSQAEVLAIPSATGDSWVFRELGADAIYYISEGCTIRLIRKQHTK